MSVTSMPAAHLLDVLGWTLIHFVWQGTLLALLLGLARLVLPRSFARARYAASCLTLALMLAVPAFTALRLADATAPASPLFEDLSGPAPDAAPASADTGASSRTAQRYEPAVDPRVVVDPDRWLPWIVLAWSLGVLACSIRLAGGWWQARRLVTSGTRPMDERWQQVQAQLATRLRLRRAVRLLESARVQVPVVVGWLKPVLLVPTAVLGGLPPRQLEAILAHELAHVRRHDYFVNLLQSAVETLLFYHPAVWWASRSVRLEREHCCDDLAVAACGDPVLYARALTAVESLRYQETGVAMAVNGSPLLARVRRLLGVRPPVTIGSSAWVVALLTALMVAGAGLTSWLRALPVQIVAEALPMPQAPDSDAEAQPPAVAAPSADEIEKDALRQSRDAESALERAMESQERALEAAARAMEQAHSAAAIRRELRSRSTEARGIAQEAMRQAHEMAREARDAMRSATRALRDATREAGRSWRYSSDDTDMHWAPEPPEPPMPPLPPEPMDGPAPAPPPSPAAPPVPPAPPAPPAAASSWDGPPAPPAPPAAPATAAPATPAAAPAPPAPPAPPSPPSPPAGWSSSRSDKSSWNVTHTRDGVTLKIDARGTIDFTEDDSDVVSISPGGHFIVERRVGGIAGLFGEVTRFEARESRGAVVRKYLSGGRELDQAEGRKWLSTFLPDVLKNLAVNADKRVARQLERGGPPLVLAEISKVQSDFARSVYLRQLYKQATLDPALLSRSFQQAAREIDSDFELSQVLRGAAERQPIDAAMPAFADASRSIGSDFEQRQALTKAVKRDGLRAAAYAAIWAAATPVGAGDGIESDFELAQLLKLSAAAGRVDDGNVAAFVEAAAHVESDFERRGVVQSAAKATLSDANMARVVRLAGGIGSNFERAQAIVSLSRVPSMGASTRKALSDAAMSIDSDFERRRAVNALTRAGVQTAAQ